MDDHPWEESHQDSERISLGSNHLKGKRALTYNAIVENTVLYGSEMRPLTKRTQGLLRAAEMV